jgi:DNA-binding transcriptional LysR family regulator
MDIQLRHLRAYLALCEEANYTRAATRLHLSQPALTRTIQQLERLVDCRLVERTSRRFALTAEGAELLAHARRILADVDGVAAELRSRATLEIGFSWLLPDAWFAATRRRYEEHGGRITLRRVDDPLTALGERTVDIAIYRKETRLPRHLASRIIATERRVLADRPLVVNTVSGTTDAASWQPVDPDRAVITCTNFDEWIELVAADRGIGVVPDLARTRAPHPGVVYLDIPDAPPSYVYVAWRARPVPSRSVQRFLGAL